MGEQANKQPKEKLKREKEHAERGESSGNSRANEENEAKLKGKLKDVILKALASVKDVELGVDLVGLGLIYGVDIDVKNRKATVKMTLTTPTCPYAGVLLRQVEEALSKIEELDEIGVELVWDPPWNVNMMSDEAKKKLGYYGED